MRRRTLAVGIDIGQAHNPTAIAGRDLKRPEDVDSSGADHGLDAMRYGINRVTWEREINLVRVR